VKTVTDLAHISAATLRWAIDRAGTTHEELASQLKTVKPSQVLAWASGQSIPRFSQAEELAKKLRIPLAVLFMANPPAIEIPIPDLRTIGNSEKAKLSLEFLDVLNDAFVKQDWYREYQEEIEAAPLPFAGRFSTNDPIKVVAADMAATLGINTDFRRGISSWQEFLTTFVRGAENIGVLVMRGAIVRHEVRRKLDPQEFRGFAISDPLAPLVFINAADAKAAQIFTLAHELAHIWIGESGISNVNPKRRRGTQTRNEIERFCNQVAAELLVPEAEFKRAWELPGDITARIKRIATFSRVSSVVVLMRAYELGKLDWPVFSTMMDAEYERFKRQQQKQQEKEGETGGDFWTSFGVRNGKKLIDSVVMSVRDGRSLHMKAANILGVKVKTLNKPLLQNQASE
jgi:Zn-dependent peptidase ImmA (M78 family)